MFRLRSVGHVLMLVACIAVSGVSQQPIQRPSGQRQTIAQQQPVGVQNLLPQQRRIPIISPKDAVQAGIARVRQQPFPTLDARTTQYLDHVLMLWEQRTEEIERYQCEFKRFDYAEADRARRNVHSSYASGQIKFMAPDKGMFRVDEMLSIAGKNGEAAQYRVDPRRKYGEYWICDGAWVHSLDRNEKTAVRHELPPELRGKQIYLSPLPFLFGVKAAEVKQRYWIQPVQPPDNTSIRLEAWPKRPDDAGSYSRVQVVLDIKTMLPKTLVVFMPNFEANNPLREVYQFEKRKVGVGLLDKLWRRDFISTKLPGDWTVTEKPYIRPQEAAAPGQGPPRVARPPAGQPARR